MKTSYLINFLIDRSVDGYEQADIIIDISVPYSQLTVCAKWTCNVHNDRIYKEQESQNT